MWLSDGHSLLIVIHKAKAYIYHALELVHIKRGKRTWLLFLKCQAKTGCSDELSGRLSFYKHLTIITKGCPLTFWDEYLKVSFPA